MIRDLMFKGKKHFGEFSDPEESISTNTLTDRLTKKGVDLLPVMLSIIDWSEKYDQNTEVP